MSRPAGAPLRRLYLSAQVRSNLGEQGGRCDTVNHSQPGYQDPSLCTEGVTTAFTPHEIYHTNLGVAPGGAPIDLRINESSSRITNESSGRNESSRITKLRIARQAPRRANACALDARQAGVGVCACALLAHVRSRRCGRRPPSAAAAPVLHIVGHIVGHIVAYSDYMLHYMSQS